MSRARTAKIRTETKRRDTSPIDRENFGNNRFQSGDVRLTSEYVFNAGFAASLGTGGDRWALSFGSAVSVNLLAGKVSILPALASAMVGSTKGDSVIAGATLGFDVGMGQGSLAGVLGPSKTDVVAAVAGSVTLSENELYRAASLSFGWGKEVGAVSGNSYTVSLTGGPTTVLDVHSVPDAINAFLLEMNNYLWGHATGGAFGPLP